MIYYRHKKYEMDNGVPGYIVAGDSAREILDLLKDKCYEVTEEEYNNYMDSKEQEYLIQFPKLNYYCNHD